VPRFHEELREQLRAEESILAEIREKRELSDELTEKLNAELKKFADGFYVEGRSAA
jgi:F0F1-type ATP synthase alpha subunit